LICLVISSEFGRWRETARQKPSAKVSNGTRGISEKSATRDDYFSFTSSYIRSYAHGGRLKQMEADNKKGA